MRGDGPLSAVIVYLTSEEATVVHAALSILLASRHADVQDETLELIRSAMLKTEVGLRERVGQ